LAALVNTTGALSAAFVQLALGMLPVLIGLFELLLRYRLTGFSEALKTTLIGFANYVFQSLTRHSSFTRAILKRKAVYIATGRSLGFQKQDPISLVTAYMHTHMFPALSILEYLIMFQIISRIQGVNTGNIPNLPVLYIVFLTILIAPALYNPDQTTDTMQEDYKQLFPKYLQVNQSIIKRKDWREKGFDNQMAEMSKKSFRNTFFADFLFYQDTWENHIFAWLVLGLTKAMLFITLAFASSVNAGLLCMLFVIWAFFGCVFLCYESQVRRACFFMAGDVGLLGGATAVGCVALLVYVGARVKSVSFFDVVAGVWIVSLVLRQAFSLCMQITSVIHFRPALVTARMTGNRENMYEVLSLQQEVFWPLYTLLLVDLTRVVSGCFLWVANVVGALLSALMWKFYLRSSRVRYIERAKTESERHLQRDGTSARDVRQDPTRRQESTRNTPRLHTRNATHGIADRLRNMAESVMGGGTRDPEAPTSPLSPKKVRGVTHM
jgi:hypothetical protein